VFGKSDRSIQLALFELNEIAAGGRDVRNSSAVVHAAQNKWSIDWRLQALPQVNQRLCLVSGQVSRFNSGFVGPQVYKGQGGRFC
jgi:hypothetical protein